MTTSTAQSFDHPRDLLRPYPGHGFFITGTGTDVGKTTATTALAAALHRLHIRLGLCKPVASGCPKRPDRGNDPNTPLTDDDFIPLDSIAPALAAGLDPRDESLLPHLAPIRYSAPVSPHLAAQVEDRRPDYRRIAAAFDFWQEHADFILVEGAGGWYVPIEPPPANGAISHGDFMIADLAAILRLPVLVVTNAELGSINQTLLTIHAIREKNLSVAGLIINRVPEPSRRNLIVQSNLEELPRLSGVPVRAILPDLGNVPFPTPIPDAFIEAILPFARDWIQQTLPHDPTT